mmetsp:Transcript_1456/g.4968  ORF Transcript_1456/g.4968 Transcript_1456/m.4968 type:complete len:80 (+) Transcript_1456:382-621(+)
MKRNNILNTHSVHRLMATFSYPSFHRGHKSLIDTVQPHSIEDFVIGECALQVDPLKNSVENNCKRCSFRFCFRTSNYGK